MRIYSIDLLKLLFAYLIAFSHLNIYLPGAGSAVAFFFIISGYFLARKYYSKKIANEKGAYNGALYTLEHIKSLYPHYIFSLVVMFAYFCVRNVYYIYTDNSSAISLMAMLHKAFYLLPEIFMVQNIGFFDGGMNYPLWQVCALLICGYFIYSLLCYNEKLSIHIIFPLSIILIQVYLKHSSVDLFDTVGMVYIPLIRAFSAIAYGVLLYKFLNSEYYARHIIRHKLFLNCCSIVALVSIFVLIDNNILFITGAFIMAALVNPNSWLNAVLNRKASRQFGEFSYAIYLNHALVIWFVRDFKNKIFGLLRTAEAEWKTAVLFFVILTVYSVVTTYIIKTFKKKRCNKL